MSKITLWLWFDTEDEEAAKFYTSVFSGCSEIRTGRGRSGSWPRC